MQTLQKYLFAPTAFSAPDDLYNYLTMQRRGFNFFSSSEDPKIHEGVLSMQKSVLSHLLHYNTLQRITDSELYGNMYSLGTFMSDLNKGIFSADINANVNSFRQNLQVDYTRMLIDILTGKSKDRIQTMPSQWHFITLSKFVVMQETRLVMRLPLLINHILLR